MALSAALLSTFANAQDGLNGNQFIGLEQSLGLVKNVFLLVDDKVTDQCWTNSEQVKEEASQAIKQLGISIYEEPLLIMSPFSINLAINALGARANDGRCIGSIELESYRSILSSYGGSKIRYRASNFSQSSVVSSSKNLNKVFLAEVKKHLSAYTSLVQAKRQDPLVQRMNAAAENKGLNSITMREFAEMFTKEAPLNVGTSSASD